MAKMGGSMSLRPNAGLKGSSGSNSLMNMMMAQSMLGKKQATLNEADIEKQNALEGSIFQTAQDLNQQYSGMIPRGSKLTRGGATVELNPRPNQQEAADIASQSILEPHFNNLTRLIDEGAVGKNPLERTMRGMLVDSGQPILTSGDERLKQLQSELNILKSKLPFDAGGKQLTGVEKELVFKLFNITGKDDQTIKYQLNFAMDMIRKRSQIAMGGLNAVSTPLPMQEPMEQVQKPMADSTPPSSVASGNRIKVVNLQTGKRGSISEQFFDPKKYQKV